MKNTWLYLIFVVGIVAITVLGALETNQAQAAFQSEWVAVQPGQAVVISHGLGYLPETLTVWVAPKIVPPPGKTLDFSAAVPVWNVPHVKVALVTFDTVKIVNNGALAENVLVIAK